MRNLQNIGMVNWVAPGGNYPVSLQPIPDVGARGRRTTVSGLVAKFEFDITTGVGGGCTGREILEWILSWGVIILGRQQYNLNGWDSMLAWNYCTDAGSMQAPDDIIAAQANARRSVFLVDPFYNPRYQAGPLGPGANEIAAAMLNEGRCSFRLGTAALNANSTVNACAVTLYAVTDERDHIDIPSLPIWESADIELFETLPAGVYSDLFFVNPSSPWAAADLTAIRIQADDGDVYRSTDPDACLAGAMLLRNLGGPLASDDMDSWEINAANMTFLPVIYPEANAAAELGRTVPALGKLLVACQGAAAGLHAVWCRWESSDSLASDALRAMGAARPRDVRVAPIPAPGKRLMRRTEAIRIPMPLRVWDVRPEVMGRLTVQSTDLRIGSGGQQLSQQLSAQPGPATIRGLAQRAAQQLGMSRAQAAAQGISAAGGTAGVSAGPAPDVGGGGWQVGS